MTDFDEMRAWMAQGTAFLHHQVQRLDDADLIAPSRLPGWSRAHVLAHLARNADALVNLLTWARTGIETPMYASPDQRDSDIDSGAQQDPAALRSDLHASGDRLRREMTELPGRAWSARVRSARGREIPATEVPWMRVREVWIHAVDLGTGASCADFPAPLVDALLGDVTTAFSAREDPPSLRLVASDRDAGWAVGTQQAGHTEVSGSAGELLGWLVGRETGTGLRANSPSGLPRPPRWL